MEPLKPKQRMIVADLLAQTKWYEACFMAIHFSMNKPQNEIDWPLDEILEKGQEIIKISNLGESQKKSS